MGADVLDRIERHIYLQINLLHYLTSISLNHTSFLLNHNFLVNQAVAIMVDPNAGKENELTLPWGKEWSIIPGWLSTPYRAASKLSL